MEDPAQGAGERCVLCKAPAAEQVQKKRSKRSYTGRASANSLAWSVVSSANAERAGAGSLHVSHPHASSSAAIYTQFKAKVRNTCTPPALSRLRLTRKLYLLLLFFCFLQFWAIPSSSSGSSP
jgi:hypothetical protein